MQRTRRTILALTSAILLFGLLFAPNRVDARWVAGNETEMLRIDRVCRDGIVVTGASRVDKETAQEIGASSVGIYVEQYIDTDYPPYRPYGPVLVWERIPLQYHEEPLTDALVVNNIHLYGTETFLWTEHLAVGSAIVVVHGESSGVFTVEDCFVATPAQQIAFLRMRVDTLVVDGVLKQDQSRALTATLDAATRQLNRGNTTAAVRQLQSFRKEVQAYMKAGILSQGEGQSLLDAANVIIQRLSR